MHRHIHILPLVLLILVACGQRQMGSEPKPVERPADHPRSSLELRAFVDAEAPGAEVVDVDGEAVYLAETVVTEEDIVEVGIGRDHFDSPYIEVELTEAAGGRFAAYTRQYMGQEIAIVVDGQVVARPKIEVELRSKFVIHASLVEDEVIQIAMGIAP